MKTTKFTLFAAFSAGYPLRIDNYVVMTIVNRIERESGDNRSYNVSGIFEGSPKTIFVRTID